MRIMLRLSSKLSERGGRANMVRIYLDVETYRPRKKEDAFVNERVIAIGLLEDYTPHTTDSLNKPVNKLLFKEWELGSEEKVIRDFYRYLMGVIMSKKDKSLTIVGFNILRMDIPLLIQKGVEYETKSMEGMGKLNQLWHNTFTIDFLQVLLSANKLEFKGLKLTKVFKLIRDELNYKDAPLVEEHGEEVAKAYEEKRYGDIEQWLMQDLYATRYLDLSGALVKLIEYSLKEGRPLFWHTE